jgi:hypothetical protein
MTVTEGSCASGPAGVTRSCHIGARPTAVVHNCPKPIMGMEVT